VRIYLLLRWLGFGLVSLGCSSSAPVTEGPQSTTPTAGASGDGTAFPLAGAASAAGATSAVAGSGGASGEVSTGGAGTFDQGGKPEAGSAGATSSAGTTQAGATDGGSAGSGVIDPARPPGQNFDLAQFALQLPVASGASVQQIKPVGDYSSEYFYTGEDGAMTFWCPVTGTTTPNSHYPRTELRELPLGGDWDIGGIHVLRAQFKMLQSPSSKGTIIGQIHGNATDGTSEVLKLEWTTENQIIASVEANDNPAQQINHTMGSYKLGQLLSYALELKGSVLTVTVTDQNGDKTFTTPYTATSWTNDKYYFKLGSYVQLDTGAATNGGRVAFYSFSIEHG
jgi:Alginate lyase